MLIEIASSHLRKIITNLKTQEVKLLAKRKNRLKSSVSKLVLSYKWDWTVSKRSKLTICTLAVIFSTGISGYLNLNNVKRSQSFNLQFTHIQVTLRSSGSIPQPTIKLTSLKRILNSSQWQQLTKWIKQHPLLGAFSFVALTYFGILGLRPIWLLRLPLDKIPKTAINPEIKISPTISAFLKYRPRVLDAWVNQRIVQSRIEFDQRRTVKDRNIYISLPIYIDEQNILDFDANALRPAFNKKNTRLSIVGEGGIGKTSLACQIAKWTMSDDPTVRPCIHLILPVLIEEDLEDAEDTSSILSAIKKQIKNLRDDEEAISDEFLRQLLQKKRILVILDRFSEMSESAQKSARLRDTDFPVNALIVTSRMEDILDRETTYTTLKPQRVSDDQLFYFIDNYLNKRGKRNLFTSDLEYSSIRERLSHILTDNRHITALLVKLYLEQAIIIRESQLLLNLPDNVPDLMLNYVNNINREIDSGLPDFIVQENLKLIAWECLRNTFKPEAAKRNEIIQHLLQSDSSLENEENAEARLRYFEERLFLIQFILPAKAKIRFTLDPLAEYLAGLYLLESYGGSEEIWCGFLKRIKNIEAAALEEIRGFLLAVRDCCISREAEAEFPSFLPRELGSLTNLDIADLEREKFRRRIQRLISDLETFDEKERIIYAAKRTAKLVQGIDIQDEYYRGLSQQAILVLSNLLGSEDESISGESQSALVEIGLLSVPMYANLLENSHQLKVRQLSAAALRVIGLNAQAAIPTLTRVLTDPDPTIRYHCVITLSKIGTLARESAPNLVEILRNDEQEGVRAYAAYALGKIGMSDVVSSMQEILESEFLQPNRNWNVLVAIIEALEVLGFDLSAIEQRVSLGDLEGNVSEVVTQWRERNHQKKEAKRRSGGFLVEWNDHLSPYTPPQTDIYNTGADDPSWL